MTTSGVRDERDSPAVGTDGGWARESRFLEVRVLTWKSLNRFLADESGPTAAEYALMLGMLILVVIAVVRSLGGGNSTMWDNNVSTITSAMGS